MEFKSYKIKIIIRERISTSCLLKFDQKRLGGLSGRFVQQAQDWDLCRILDASNVIDGSYLGRDENSRRK